VSRVEATVARARAAGDEGAALADRLSYATSDLVATTAALGALGDPAAMLADASAYLEATGHVVVAWIWLQQWLVADDRDGDFYAGKRAAATYFLTRELPKVAAMLALLREHDRLTLDLDAAVL